MRKPKRGNYYSKSEQRDSHEHSSQSATHHKVFNKDEGEYVDYEEIE